MRNINYLLWDMYFKKAVLIPLFLVLCSVAYAQTNAYIFSGKVTDQATDEAVTGASVYIENTTLGAVTDFDGNYSFNGVLTPGDYTLIVSSLGYATKRIPIVLSRETEVVTAIQLVEDLLSLDEVIITGTAGNSSRRTLGNAIGTIKAEEIENTGSNNVLSAISGKVLGAYVSQNQGDPGGGFSVNLRGASTVFGSSEPLYIIDGVIVDNSSQNVINRNADAMQTGFAAGQNRLVDINPNDIERIEVLNGASASAIYGSLASNGVVQIFTKRGASGNPKITFATTSMVSVLRNRLDFNDYGQRFGYPGDERLSTTGDRLTTIADLRSAAERAETPGTGPAALAGRPLVENTYNVNRYDYQDNLFRLATGTETYFSISGGNNERSYFLSTSYNRNQGILKDTHFQKYGVRFNMVEQMTDFLSISIGGTYNNSSSEDKPNGNNFFSPISTMIIIDNVWDITERDAFGNLMHVEQQRVNPLSVIEEFEITQETDRFIGSVQADLDLKNGLSVGYKFGLDTYSLTGNTFQPRLPYGPVAASFFPDGYVSIANSKVFRTNQDVTVNFEKNISPSLRSTTTGGVQYIYQRSDFSIAEGRDLLGFIKTINAAQNLFNPPRATRVAQSIWGFHLQENIAIADKVYVTLAGRIDGASVFGKNERNQFYPKVSTSIIASDFDFWKNSSINNFWNVLKLRASYGEAGNLTVIGPFDRFTNATSVLLAGQGGFLPSAQLGDENIRPERMKEFEVGADLSFLNNRLGVQFTYYNQDIEDLVLRVTLAPSSGGSSTVRNIGSMQNKGVEFLLTGSPVKTSDISWNTSVVLSTYDNTLSNIGGGRAGIPLRGGGGVQSAIDGLPIGTFFATYYARNPDGSLLLTPEGLPQVERGDDFTGIPERDETGQPTGTPIRKALGDPNPDYTASFINEIRYKKFTARLQFDAVQGFEVYNWNTITGNNVGNGLLAERELRGEVPRGWTAAVGGFIGPRIQEEHVEDGSFVKLREVLLGYDIGAYKFFENINISLIGRNLISFDNYSGFDPETNSAGQNTRVRGDDFGNIPIPASVQLKFTFSM